MSFFTELNNGLSAYGKAHKVLMQYKLGKYLVLPALISLGYCILFFVGIFFWYRSWEIDPADLPWWISWMGAVSNWLIGILFWVTAIWLFFATFKYVLQTIMAPFLGELSEAIERKIKGQEPPKLNPGEVASDIFRALRLSVRNLIMEILISFAVNFVPVVGFLLVFVVSAYYTGFGFMDYVLERRRYNTRASLAFLRQHKGLAVGIGLPMNFALMVPVIGWMFAPTYATAAATLELLELPEYSRNQR